MNAEIAAERRYRVAVFAGPDDPQELSEVLSETLGIHPTDAIIHSRRAPGILPDLLTLGDATRLAAAIEKLGLRAEAVATADIPNVEHGEAVHHAKCGDAGLEIIGLSGDVVATIPWNDVELICVGVVPTESARHYATRDMTVLSSARRTAHPALDIPLAEGPELWIVRRSPLHAFCIDHKHMNYEDLESRKTDSATVNFRLFLETLLQHAPQAYVTPSTRSFLNHAAKKHVHFPTTDELSRYVQFHLLAHRLLLSSRSSGKLP